MTDVIGINAKNFGSIVRIFRFYAYQFFFLMAFLFLVKDHLYAQQPIPEDYDIYSSIIRNEISDSAQSIALVRGGIQGKEVTEYTQNLASALKSGNQNSIQHLHSWTESGAGERPTTIDTLVYPYILDYCSYPSDAFELSNWFQIQCKVVMLNRYPIRANNNKEDWNHFYEEYPGSGGIFSFSRVLFYDQTRTTAIVYFWHRRYELNGHGALVILKKQDKGWAIQYKTYLWWN
jgi:hypothetical protein